jgi:hypothetical protein
MVLAHQRQSCEHDHAIEDSFEHPEMRHLRSSSDPSTANDQRAPFGFNPSNWEKV